MCGPRNAKFLGPPVLPKSLYRGETYIGALISNAEPLLNRQARLGPHLLSRPEQPGIVRRNPSSHHAFIDTSATDLV